MTSATMSLEPASAYISICSCPSHKHTRQDAGDHQHIHSSIKTSGCTDHTSSQLQGLKASADCTLGWQQYRHAHVRPGHGSCQCHGEDCGSRLKVVEDAAGIDGGAFTLSNIQKRHCQAFHFAIYAQPLHEAGKGTLCPCHQRSPCQRCLLRTAGCGLTVKSSHITS
eukprot:3300568-Rhodomonas_salina.1